jgi:guanylate kinase
MRHWDEFDYIIVNDNVTEAAEALAEVVSGRGDSYSSKTPAIRDRVADLLAGQG